MTLSAIWRYPVKTTAGESLTHARLGPLGIAGDRVVHVEDADGHLLTSRSHPRFLGLSSTLDADGAPLINGAPWQSQAAAAWVEAIGGKGARLVWDESDARFDVLPLLVATDGAIAAFGHDARRLRPNLIVGGVEGLSERSWEGKTLRVGAALVGVQDLRQRCVMTSFDPDTQVQDKEITRSIYRRFEGKLALNCFVIEPAEIHVGDKIALEGEWG